MGSEIHVGWEPASSPEHKLATRYAYQQRSTRRSEQPDCYPGQGHRLVELEEFAGVRIRLGGRDLRKIPRRSFAPMKLTFPHAWQLRELYPIIGWRRRKFVRGKSGILALTVDRDRRPMNHPCIIAAQEQNHARNLFRLWPLREIGFGHRPSIRFRVDDARKDRIHADTGAAHVFGQRVHHC